MLGRHRNHPNFKQTKEALRKVGEAFFVISTEFEKIVHSLALIIHFKIAYAGTFLPRQ